MTYKERKELVKEIIRDPTLNDLIKECFWDEWKWKTPLEI